MTIRSGGRPRGDRSPQARPYDADAYATASEPVYEPARRGGRGDRGGGSRGGGGLWGLVRFLLFALVLAGLVLIALLTALRPLVNHAILGWAAENPAALNISFVKDIVRDDLGPKLTDPMSTDPSQVEFVVQPGDTASSIATRLQGEGLLADQRAFVFISVDRDLTAALQQGTFLLRKNMTPDQMVTALLDPPANPYVDIALRPGLRLEQITAKLETLPLEMDVQDFYDLVKHPTAELLTDYPWLKTALADAPDGASLEGFLWAGTYRVLPDTTPEELVRDMLDKFIAAVGQDRLDVAKSRGLDFYQVLTLASIVEREAFLDSDRPLIAGVYQNRLDPKLFPTRLLQSDPTIFFVHDSLQLATDPIANWVSYVFWAPIKGGLTDDELPPDLAPYNTYTHAGLPPGPIDTPSLPSIDAALAPNTSTGYLFFIAKGDGSNETAFAKTYKDHLKNVAKYGKP
jgi:UPF0755 protein